MISDDGHEGLAALGRLRPLEDVIGEHLDAMEQALARHEDPESVRLARLAEQVGVLRRILAHYREMRARPGVLR